MKSEGKVMGLSSEGFSWNCPSKRIQKYRMCCAEKRKIEMAESNLLDIVLCRIL